MGILTCSAILTTQIPSQAGYVTVVRTVYKAFSKIPGSARMLMERGKWFLCQGAANQWISFHAKTDINLFFFLCFFKLPLKTKNISIVAALEVWLHLPQTDVCVDNPSSSPAPVLPFRLVSRPCSLLVWSLPWQSCTGSTTRYCSET